METSFPRRDLQTPSVKKPSNRRKYRRFVRVRSAVVLLLGRGNSSVGVVTNVMAWTTEKSGLPIFCRAEDLTVFHKVDTGSGAP